MVLKVFSNQYLNNLNQDLAAVIGSVHYFLPEIVLTGFLFLLIAADLFTYKNKKSNITAIISGAGFIVVAVIVLLQGDEVFRDGSQRIFLDMLYLDRLSVYLKFLFCLAGLLTVLISLRYKRRGEMPIRYGEYHTLIYGLILGAFLLVMSVNLLIIYLAIEIISICSYVLTNFNFGRKSAEASLKYLLFGAVASAIMLYGMSLLYGFAGTLDISSQAFSTNLALIPTWSYYVAVSMTLVGFIFKIGAAPFHIWAPDVYEGAPIPVVALFSTVPKIAAIIILLRFLGFVPLENMTLDLNWMRIFSWIAIVTMLIGNLSALWQKNAKRMMAYSSIAHAGFMLAGVVAFSEFGIESLLFYASVYLLMNFAAFLLIKILCETNRIEKMSDFSGMGKEMPFIGIASIIIMLSLTGLPPTAGFTAKLLIFSSVWDTYQTNHEPVLLVLFIVGLLNSVLALFYYLKIPYYLYFHSRGDGKSVFLQSKKKHGLQENILLGFLIFPLLVLFFKPSWLTDFINLLN